MAQSARSIISGKKNSVPSRFNVPPPSSAPKVPSSLASKSFGNRKDPQPKVGSVPKKVEAVISNGNDQDEAITWKPATEFLQSELITTTNGSNGSEAPVEQTMRREPSYIRLSRILNGYLTNAYTRCTRSKTPDPNATRRSHESPLKKKVLANGNAPKSFGSSKTNGQDALNGDKMAHVDPRLEHCSSYSFKLPDFAMENAIVDGQCYKKLVENVLTLLKSHLEKTNTLLLHQDLLPEEVAESVRVAVGRTELLLKKRILSLQSSYTKEKIRCDDQNDNQSTLIPANPPNKSMNNNNMSTTSGSNGIRSSSPIPNIIPLTLGGNCNGTLDEQLHNQHAHLGDFIGAMESQNGMVGGTSSMMDPIAAAAAWSQSYMGMHHTALHNSAAHYPYYPYPANG